MKTEKILIVADESPGSLKAIRYGLNLARELGSAVMLLYVIEPELTAGNPDAGIFPDDALATCKAKAESFLTSMKDTYGADLNTSQLTPVGAIQGTVVDTALNWNAGLIVAAAHGHSGLNKLFAGSIAETIIHSSPVPVLVVPQS